MTQIIDWDAVGKRIRDEQWAAEFYTTTKKTVHSWIETYGDSPEREAGWFHDYNCTQCSSRLEFRLDNPAEHLCPACGHLNRDEKLDNAWNNRYRGMANSYVLSAAVLHRIDEDGKYLQYMRNVLDFYSSNYDQFSNEAVAKRFEGKIMNQHLDDAVGMMTILLGMTMVRDEFSEAELERYYRELFAREADLFDFFAFRIYNIPLWIKCAEAMIGIFFGKTELIDRAFYEHYGILDQLTRGVTADGMWYEGSIHYHFYCLQPLSYLLFVCKSFNFHLPEMDFVYDTTETMFIYPLTVMFRNRQFPNPNDAHPLLTLDRYAAQYEYASVLFDNPAFQEVCGTFHTNGESSGSLSRLLFNTWPACKRVTEYGTVNNEASYTAMLKSRDTEVFLKYGAHTDLHVHPDTMNLEIAFDGEVVASDLGSGGYASFLFVEWQRLTPCHNTVAVDMKSMRTLCDGIVEEFDPEENYIKVKAKGVYDAVNYTRAIQVKSGEVADKFIIEAKGEYLYDWFFYCIGNPVSDYDTTPVEKLGSDNGYQHLFDIRMFETGHSWHVDFQLRDKVIRVEMEGEPETEVYIVNSYTDSTEHTRYGIMVRRRAENTVFTTRYTCIK